MFEKIRIFFGFAPDPRVAEGWMSWQHLLLSTLTIAMAVILGIYFGKKNQNRSEKDRIRVLKIAACLIVGLELVKIGIICWRNHDIQSMRSTLPLFLCSIMLLSLPIAAFGKGRLREAAMDFSFSFGMLCAVAGTYLAGNIFSGPIVRFDPLVSVTTHCISGFASVYVGVTGLAKMKKKNLWISAMILLVFELTALVVDIIQIPTPYQSNYMFFISPDGTPFSILLALAKGKQAVYTVLVGMIYFVYLGLFDLLHALFAAVFRKRKSIVEGE